MTTEHTESNLVAHAREELRRAGLFDDDAMYGGMIGEATLRMVEVFADEGHSGYSAGISISVLEKLLRFEPLTPLTGDEDEWTEVADGVFQNRRCSHVFRENGEAYDIDGRVFREPNGACYTSRDSRVPVTFPYTPTTEYVDVEAAE